MIGIAASGHQVPLKPHQEFGRTENAREFPARVPAERSRF
jgi:hypothetical protein